LAASSSIRILVAEDYKPFLRFLSSKLQNRPKVQVIYEVYDGIQAVQEAQRLQPDLILLDVGLPKLNGIEAARRIRKLSPQSKILFVSQESSADVVQEALSTGALGYLVKTDAASELMIAVETVLRGEHFVSARFARHDFIRRATQAHDNLGRNVAGTSPALPRKVQNTRCHEAWFYSDDMIFLETFTEFIGSALKAGNAAVVVATEPHRNSLLARLHGRGLDIAAAIQEGRYIPLDAAETVSAVMVKGLPDRVRFLKNAVDLIEAAAKIKKENARVSVCGECAPFLWSQGNAEAAIRLEHLWDEVAKSYDIDVLCGYSLGTFQGGVGSHIFEKICAEHSAVYSR
jgi:DNA-binding NarL/FixJ family response regulator